MTVAILVQEGKIRGRNGFCRRFLRLGGFFCARIRISFIGCAGCRILIGVVFYFRFLLRSAVLARFLTALPGGPGTQTRSTLPSFLAQPAVPQLLLFSL